MGVPFSDIKAIVLAGFKSSFLPFHEKQALLRQVSAELEQYDDYGQRSAASEDVRRPVASDDGRLHAIELRAAEAS